MPLKVHRKSAVEHSLILESFQQSDDSKLASAIRRFNNHGVKHKGQENPYAEIRNGSNLLSGRKAGLPLLNSSSRSRNQYQTNYRSNTIKSDAYSPARASHGSISSLRNQTSSILAAARLETTPKTGAKPGVGHNLVGVLRKDRSVETLKPTLKPPPIEDFSIKDIIGIMRSSPSNQSVAQQSNFSPT